MKDKQTMSQDAEQNLETRINTLVYFAEAIQKNPKYTLSESLFLRLQGDFVNYLRVPWNHPIHKKYELAYDVWKSYDVIEAHYRKLNSEKTSPVSGQLPDFSLTKSIP